jgi:hypothetical protein
MAKKINKEKVVNAYKRGLVSLEIIKLKKMPVDIEEAEKLYDDLVKHKTYLIDDLSEPYMIRLVYTENKAKLNSVDPDNISEGDQYELSESIQEILRENHFPVIESNFPQKKEEK